MDFKKEIMQTFNIREGDTPPYVGRNGDRNTLATLFNKFGYKIGAEIGVWKGEYSEVLCKAIPGLTLYCVDPWKPFKQSGESGSYRRAEQRWAQTNERLAPYPGVVYKRMTSLDAIKEIPDGILDFVYIDAMHFFDSAMLDIINWAPKVKKGGIVSGHDYFYHPEVGVVQAVNAYTLAHNIRDLYITYEQKECQSFFWVVE